jgi:hypothetical protein
VGGHRAIHDGHLYDTKFGPAKGEESRSYVIQQKVVLKVTVLKGRRNRPFTIIV